MGIAEAKLEVSYKFSTDVKSEMPHCLTSSAHLLRLIDTASQYIHGDIKTRSKKPFSVIIISKVSSETMTKPKSLSDGKTKPVSLFL